MATTIKKQRRILVVDDEALVLDSLRMLLEVDGHEVTTATSGPEALERMNRTQFDLVFTDYSMEPMKGDQLATAIKRKNPTLPVVMVTAYLEKLTRSSTPLACIDAIIPKPFQLQMLRDAINKLG